MHPTEPLEELIQVGKQQEKAGIVAMGMVSRFESTDSNQ